MEIKKVKDLKAFLATLPEEADKWDIQFTEKGGEGILSISHATTGKWDEESYKELKPERLTKNFVLLSCGKI